MSFPGQRRLEGYERDLRPSAKIGSMSYASHFRLPVKNTHVRACYDSLASFLSPFLNQSHPQQAQARIVTTPRSQPSSPRTSITMSMIGQAASVTNGHSEIDTDDRRRVSKDLDSEGSDWDLDTVIQRVCGESLGDEDFKDLILKEKLDEKDSMLMDGNRVSVLVESCSLMIIMQQYRGYHRQTSTRPPPCFCLSL